ncbi:protein sorting-associated protein 13A [Seminavis robusta]|uniref:Protein sorting-associated protein 13A n=1 Tax=Seminavis robusta TaxID=568900 RepID=A0A9N8HMT4_9STRA|nr:protein sorting-associated protein 13A [Seminavis robusta]|eukprot:Sro1025_g232820.1 protein sorting-associated protein 13A (2547) ;mRNA; f:28828-36819
MAKAALLGVLESTIGKYVVDLDAEKLNLGIWSGQVELHDLQLDVHKCNAELDRQAAEAPNLALPLRVVGGSFSSVKLQIPWASLSSQSVVVQAHGLHIHVAPYDRLTQTDFLKQVVDSEEKRAQHVHQQRQHSLELANENRMHAQELLKLTQLDTTTPNKNSNDEQGSSFVSRLVKRIVENLQVDIQDVQVTLQGDAGTAGVVLENLSFVTTDMAGHRTFVDRTNQKENPNDLLNKFLYKNLTIQGLAIYMDEPTSSDNNTTHSYILDPLSLDAKAREADASITKEYPKWLLKSNIPSVQLGLGQRQYQQTMQLLAAMAPSPHAARPLFPEYRPLHRITAQSAKQWWRYAFTSVSRLNGRRSWVIFFEAFQARKTYIALWKRHATKNKEWMTPLSPDELETMHAIEADRTISIEGIMMWRNLADAQVEKERQKRQKNDNNSNKQPKKKKGMLSNLFGGKSDTDTEEKQDIIPISLSAEELKELENVGLDQLSFGQELSHESKLCRVEFVLGELKINLFNENNSPILGLDMGTASSTFDADQGGTFTFEHSLQSLEVSDHLHSSSLFPKVLRSLVSSKEEEEPAFHVHVSHAKTGDKKLTVKLVPFEIVVAPHLLSEVMDFVKVPSPHKNNDSSSLLPQIEEIKEEVSSSNNDEEKDDGKKDETTTTAANVSSDYAEDISNALVDAWQKKTKEKTLLTIDLNLKAPILILPENCSDPNASVCVFDLGAFRFQTGLKDDINGKVDKWLEDNPRDASSYDLTNNRDDNKNNPEFTGKVVDHGRIELVNMTLLVGKAEKWREIRSDQDGMMVHNQDESIIEPITVRFDFAIESVVASSIPRACVFASIPSSNFKFSPNHLTMTLQVYNAWMKTLESVRGGDAAAPAKPSLTPKADAAASNDSAPQAPSTEQIIVTKDSGEESVKVEIDDVTNTVETSLGNHSTLFTTMHLNITTERYSVVVYDSGDFQSKGFNAKGSQSGSISPIQSIAEGLVLEGGLELSFETASDMTGNTSSSTVELRGQDFQLYSAFGRDLRRPLQILEPVTGSLKVGLISQGLHTKKADLKARCHGEIDLTFSMRNMALIKSISAEVSQCLEDGLKRTNAESVTLETLDEEKKQEIEAMAAALENNNGDEDERPTPAKRPSQVQLPSNDGIIKENASSTIFSINVKVPRTKLTIINDLQGLDEALFRIQTEEFITRSLIANMCDLDNAMLTQTTFNVKAHSKILADYYDPSVNLWNPLLKEPWEIAFKSERVPDRGAKSDGRYSAKTDIHFGPMHLSFSEYFLIGLGSANRMVAMSAELEQENNAKTQSDEKKGDSLDSAKKPRSHSTRNLVAALPYALDNYSGVDVEYSLAHSQAGSPSHACPNGQKTYFRFNPPKGSGQGGKRLYGQDVLDDQPITIMIGDNKIKIKNIDHQLGQPKRCHIIDDGTTLVTTVVKEGKSTVVRLSSNTYMQNRSPIPIHVAFQHESKTHDIGMCSPTSSLLEDNKKHKLVPYDVKGGTLTTSSRRMGVRFEGMDQVVKEWADKKNASAIFKVSPQLGGSESRVSGQFCVEIDVEMMQKAENNTIRSRIDVVCSADNDDSHSFALQANVKLQLIQGVKLVSFISFEPRSQLVNTLPINITVLTRVPHCYSQHTLGKSGGSDKVHDLEPGGKIEVFSAGDSLQVKVRSSESPRRGTPLGVTRQWIPIPMVASLEKPILCLLPFVAEQEVLSSTGTPGNEFFIAEANSSLPNFFLERINDDGDLDLLEPEKISNHTARTFLFTVGNYAVDHTKGVLFEQLVTKSKGFFRSSNQNGKAPLPFGDFTPKGSQQSISLLPTSEIPLRLAKRGADRTQRSSIFRIEEVSMTEGGAQATPLLWDNGKESGIFLYRKLISSFQSELHVIAEFIVYNADPRLRVVVKQAGGHDVSVAPNQSAPVFAVDRQKGLLLSFQYDALGGSTKPLRLEELGLHIELVKTPEGASRGSLAVQTSIGTVDSRLVIRLGEVGEIERRPVNPLGYLPTSFNEDNIRLRIQAEKFALTLNQAVFENLDSDGKGVVEHAGAATKQSVARSALAKSLRKPTGSTDVYKRTELPICTLTLNSVVYDVQKLYKPKEELNENDIPERCQLSLIIEHFQITDETPNSPFPLVFSFEGKNRFVDFCLRTKGPLYASNVTVDLFDLILAHSGVGDDQSGDKMCLQTSEAFVWKLIDLADRIIHASSEGAHPTDGGEYEYEKALEAFVPAFSKDLIVQHTGPQIAKIYDIAKARVSPFSILVSFKRRPDAERYKEMINNRGANLMRYFTQQLKFTIDNCDLHFARYEEYNVKGPMDRLIEILSAVYLSRMKLKVVTILAAASFGDWKNLASRDGGDDEFVDGDVLRVTGAVAGNSVAFALNKAGAGLHKSVTWGFDALGDNIENGAALLGAHDFGAGTKTVISGVGGAIGGTASGIADGAGGLFKGAGEGLGHFFGGLTGGGSRIVKGVGKSITTGDGKALATGVAEGVGHVGKGIRGSIMAIGTGVGGSVTSVVSGSVTGVRESVNSSVTGSTKRKQIRGLAKLREEFKDQDYS